MKIKHLYDQMSSHESITIKGWVYSTRGNDKIRFITINDGSTFKNLQLVVKNNLEDSKNVRLGAAIFATGKLVMTPKAQQPFELLTKELKLLKQTDLDYPLQKQKISREILREIPHLRVRTNLFRAIMRIRSTLALNIHDFFKSENFLYISAPIITGNDGEGAGETFLVKTDEGDFFNQKATLGVTGQLHAEAYANGFGDVYTFAPTFRAENSHTQKHAAEFWMIEPEMAFATKEEGIELAEKLLKYTIRKTLQSNREELDFLNQQVDYDLCARLEKFLETGFSRITYRQALAKLNEVKEKFDEKNIVFGLDLGTEHEKYLAEEIFKGPVAVTDYPSEIKAFYMKENGDGTVGAFDILVPGIGELVGGSERETDYQKIEAKVKKLKINQEDLQWYLDLRRYGQFQSTGFGLGFERLVMYVTGIENIRDVLPFPRTPNNLKM